MVNESDFRKGVYVLENGVPVEVDAFDIWGNLIKDDMSCENGCAIKNPEGIQITPDLLNKCGFGFTVSETTTYFIPIGDKLRIEFDESLICGLALEMWDRRMRIPIIAEIEYLHQLQNLYHSHTGKELEIKL